MFRILTLNQISVAGLERLPRDRYEVASEIGHPDAVLVRSANMHEFEIPASLKAVARAGAGVNNIPIGRMTERGIPVFNAPGANANAVKELTIAGMLLAARNLCQALRFVGELDGDETAMHEAVEKGKSRFRGFELPGRTLGVIGLGAVGVQVANAARGLGMQVVGYDPQITVERAWQLSFEVAQAASVGDLFARSDFVSLHVPLVEGTRHLVDAGRLARMREGATLLNFARGGIVDEDAVLAALDAGRLGAYVCDFPTPRLVAHPCVIALPHIGASTREAEDNCAIMVADRLRDYLEDGTIRNSVNFPEVHMPRNGGDRLALVNANVPNMLGQISTTLASAGLNILDMINKSKGDVAFTLADVEQPLPGAVIEALGAIEGVLSVRALSRPAPGERALSEAEARLAELRRRIDAIDEQLLRLVGERAGVAAEVASTKNDGEFYRPDREAQILRRATAANPGPIPDVHLARILREVMSACRALQKPMTVAFLGPEGTFTEAAAFKHFGHAVSVAPLATIDAVFREVESGAADYGVVPVENSTEGVVNHTLDTFVRSTLSICGEVELRIHHCLMSGDGDLSRVRRVYSHQQSLAQCRGWLDAKLPGVARVAVDSNAEAARRAAAEEDAAAIAGEVAADVYALRLVARNVEDDPDNTTRFLVVGRHRVRPSGDDKTSVLFSARNRPGALFDVLAVFKRHGIDMTRIESRPSRGGVWDYVFFVDFLGHADDPNVAEALRELADHTTFLKTLGSYPRLAGA